MKKENLLKFMKSILFGFLFGLFYFLYYVFVQQNNIIISFFLSTIPIIFSLITFYLILKDKKNIVKRIFFSLLTLSILFYLILLPFQWGTEVIGFYLILAPFFLILFFVLPITLMSYIIKKLT